MGKMTFFFFWVCDFVFKGLCCVEMVGEVSRVRWLDWSYLPAWFSGCSSSWLFCCLASSGLSPTRTNLCLTVCGLLIIFPFKSTVPFSLSICTSALCLFSVGILMFIFKVVFGWYKNLLSLVLPSSSTVYTVSCAVQRNNFNI